jgi:aspartate/methionine/tyrosine aminotransferase
MKLPHFKLDRYFQRHAYGSLINLCASDCEPWTVQALQTLAPELAEQLPATVLQYPEYEGIPRLRQVIAHRYRDMDQNSVLVTTGAEEAIFLLMNVLLDTSMHMVVHSPCYQSLISIAQSIGCHVSLWKPQEDQRWQLDLDFLKTQLAQGARVVVVNSPHNPSGACISAQSFREIVALCQQYDAYLISDEVYRGLEHDTGDCLPAAAEVYAKGISIGDMSKTFGMPGLRIGWLVMRDHSLLAELCAFKDFTTISASAVSQVLAATALEHASAVVEKNLQRILTNKKIFTAFLERNGDWCSAHVPTGGTTALLRLKNGQADQFCDTMRERAKVMLLPGSVFDLGEHHLRIGLGRERFGEGLGKIEQAL